MTSLSIKYFSLIYVFLPVNKILLSLLAVEAAMNCFAAEESFVVRRAQTGLNKNRLVGDLVYLRICFKSLAYIKEKLECSGASLTWNEGLIVDVQKRFAIIQNGPVTDKR